MTERMTEQKESKPLYVPNPEQESAIFSMIDTLCEIPDIKQRTEMLNRCLGSLRLNVNSEKQLLGQVVCVMAGLLIHTMKTGGFAE